MSDTNVNLTSADISALNDARGIAWAERKKIRTRRYRRRYLRICEQRFAAKGQGECAFPWWQDGGELVRVSDIVTVTIGPLFAVTYPIDSLGLI